MTSNATMSDENSQSEEDIDDAVRDVLLDPDAVIKLLSDLSPLPVPDAFKDHPAVLENDIECDGGEVRTPTRKRKVS